MEDYKNKITKDESLKQYIIYLKLLVRLLKKNTLTTKKKPLLR